MARTRIRVLAWVAAVTALSACTAQPHEPPRSIEAAPPQSAIESSWMLAPTTTLSPETTQFDVLVSHHTCAGGLAGTVYPPEVAYLSDSVDISFMVDVGSRSFGSCVLSPPAPFTVELDEPLGQRFLRDGHCEEAGNTGASVPCTVSGWNVLGPVTPQ